MKLLLVALSLLLSTAFTAYNQPEHGHALIRDADIGRNYRVIRSDPDVGGGGEGSIVKRMKGKHGGEKKKEKSEKTKKPEKTTTKAKTATKTPHKTKSWTTKPHKAKTETAKPEKTKTHTKKAEKTKTEPKRPEWTKTHTKAHTKKPENTGKPGKHEGHKKGKRGPRI